jgi:uncharacterized membrane-anchored protein
MSTMMDLQADMIEKSYKYAAAKNILAEQKDAVIDPKYIDAVTHYKKEYDDARDRYDDYLENNPTPKPE